MATSGLRRERRVAVAACVALGVASCVGDAGPSTAATLPPSTSTECLVDGAPLEAIEGPTRYCADDWVSEPYANGLRLYQQEHYDAALASLEAVVLHGPDPAGELEWHAARFWAAKCNLQLERETEARTAFLDIVRTPDDPFRWVAAGWLCGERRHLDISYASHDPDCPVSTPRAPGAIHVPADAIPASDVYAHDPDGIVPRLPHLSWLTHVWGYGRTAYLGCGDGRQESASVTYTFDASGTVEAVRVADEHHASLDGTPLGACLEGVARRFWMPPFGSASYELTNGVTLLAPGAPCAIGPTPCPRDLSTTEIMWRFMIERCDSQVEARLHIAVTAVSDGTIRDVVVEGALVDGTSISGSAFQACVREQLGGHPMRPFTDPTFTLEADLEIPDAMTRSLRAQRADRSAAPP